MKLFPTRWRTPYHVQSLVTLMYAIKFVTKWKILGVILGSAAISGDGIHNLADAFPSMMVIAIFWMNKQQSNDSMFGFKQIEGYLMTLMGAVLLFTGFKIGIDSTLGLISLSHGGAKFVDHLPLYHYQHVRMVEDAVWTVAPFMLLNAVVSFAIANLQINVGKEAHSAASVVDGKETRMDGVIELAEFVSILLVQGAGWRAAESVIGYVVMICIMRTGWEIFKPSLDIVRMRRLSAEANEKIERALEVTPGVDSIKELRHCRVGPTTVFCIARTETTRPVEQHAALRYALWVAAKKALKAIDEDLVDFDIHIVLKTPIISSQRIAYFARKIGEWRVVKSTEATHLLICDPRQGDPSVGRLKDHAIPFSPNAPREIIIGATLLTKYVRALRVLRDDDVSKIAGEVRSGLEVERAYFRDPFLDLGMKKPK